MCSNATGVNQIAASGAGIKLVPNPTSGRLHLVLPDNSVPASVFIMDATGRQVAAFEHTCDLDLSRLEAGVYFVSLRDNLARKVLLRCIKY
jgi:hypothetical protein